MSKGWKVYTKTGDKGETALIGGKRIPKYDDQIEAYGTIDELCAWVGLLSEEESEASHKTLLGEICANLFTVESHFAAQDSAFSAKLPGISEQDVVLLEQAIDQMNEKLPELSAFILPYGTKESANCHVARTVCRRAERRALKVAQAWEQHVMGVKYLNRLSDYLFVLARYRVHTGGGKEVLWQKK